MTKQWKAILLAGGSGTRLHPLTLAVNKHLLPVYNKPMIYYSLSILMLAGLRDIIVVTSPDGLPALKRVLKDGSQWGLNIEYREQPRPEGIAQCFGITADLTEGCNVTLVLGDNIFHGTGLQDHLASAVKRSDGATIFGYEVTNPSSFGVVVLNDDGRPKSLEEKPEAPSSRLAVPGIYFFDQHVTEIAAAQRPSARGEYEITDVNLEYLRRGNLHVQRFGRGTVWLDGGTYRDLYEAGQFVKVVEERTGMKIACPEEIAFRQGFISKSELATLVNDLRDGDYKRYLEEIG